MTLLAFGLNHNTAPLGIREQAVFPPDSLPQALPSLHHLRVVEEAAILSTCHRTEIYCSLGEAHREIPYRWFCEWQDLDVERMRDYCYHYVDSDAVRHMLRVASGLDSMVLGEPQILGQVKLAYRNAQDAGSLGKLLSRLFQHSFRVAKQIRSHTAIGAHPVSIAFAAVRLARQIFGELGHCTALLIGAGEFTDLAAFHLREQGLKSMIFTNRTIEHAQHLAERHQAYTVPLHAFPGHLAEADIILSSTASPRPMVSKASLQAALRMRKRQPMLLLDMAVPRDIEPEAGSLQDVYLYTVDELKDIVEDNLHSRKAAALQAEQIITAEVTQFCHWVQALNAVDTIRALRKQAERQRQEILATTLSRLRSGADPIQLLHDATRRLSRRILHPPTSCLYQAGAEGNTSLLRACRTLFALKENQDSPADTMRETERNTADKQENT